MNKEMSVHDKAIRLLEGGIVDVDGHAVKVIDREYISDPCFCCDMDCLCHSGNEMCLVCTECDDITGHNCFLCLVEPNGNK